jgi:hypothetical protein
MQTDPTKEGYREKITHIEQRLNELSNTSSQILIFLSFAIVAAVTFFSPGIDATRRSALSGALRWWTGAIFPTVMGIIPLKVIANDNLPWYTFILWLRYVLLWCAIICIFLGALRFYKAI